MLSHVSRVWLCDSVDCSLQAPLSLGLSRQEYWSELPCPSPGGLPNPGIKSMSLSSPALAGRFFTASATWEGPDLQVSPQTLLSCCGSPSNMAIRMPEWAQLLVTALIISESESCVFPFCFSLPLRKDHVIPSSTGSKVCRMSPVLRVQILNHWDATGP